MLAPWGGDGFLYPAVIVDVHAASVHVAYLDGDEADVPLGALRQGVLGPGVKVNVNWKGRRTYFNGTIQKRINQAVFVDFEDGDRGWSTLAQCRVRATELEAVHPTTSVCTHCGSVMSPGANACAACGAPRRLHS